MKSKFIPICLFILLILLICGGAFFTASSQTQPLLYGEDVITFPAPSMAPLPQQPANASVVDVMIPIVLIFVILTLAFLFIKKHIVTLKKYFPKILCVLLCVVSVCASSLVLNNSIAADTSFTPVDESQYYGRVQLQKMANSKSLLYAYDQMAQGIENHVAEIKIRTDSLSVTSDEWQVVLYSYLYDYPQHFWMGNEYKYNYITSTDNEIIINAIFPNYLFSESELVAAKKNFNIKAKEILDSLSPSMGQYELELAIHDKLCSRIVYKDDEHAHTAYGGLVTGNAVCEGYGKAFQYLLNQVGIESTMVAGTGTPANTGITEDHAWNLIKIDGEYYFTDLTWDDQTSEPYYAYFNITTDMLEEDHTIAHFPYQLPHCTATKENYFIKNNKTVPSFSVEKITELLQYNLKTHVYITGNTTSFNSDVLNSNNSKQILSALNMVSSSTIRINTLARERVITVVGRRYGDVNGDNILDDKDIALIDEYSKNSSVITDATALKAADYNKDGKIDTLDSQKLANFLEGLPEPPPPSSTVPSNPSTSNPDHDVSVSSPTIDNSNNMDSTTSQHPDMPNGTLGDVNGDNKIDAKDALVVLRIAVDKQTPTDTEKFVSDVNKDSIINAKDALEILKKAVNKPACF